MDAEVAKQRLRRLLLVFAVAWSAIFGYQAYTAYGNAKAAHDSAQIARVGPALLGASGVDPDISASITGSDELDQLESAELSTRKKFHASLWLLLGGLVGGCSLIAAGYWVMYGSSGLRTTE